MPFISIGSYGRFINQDGFLINFTAIIKDGYFFKQNEKNLQVKHYLRNVKTRFVLEHWNKPEGQCGLFDSRENSYICLPLSAFKQPFTQKECYRVEIDPTNKVKPTYCVLYLNSKIEKKYQGILDIVKL